MPHKSVIFESSALSGAHWTCASFLCASLKADVPI